MADLSFDDLIPPQPKDKGKDLDFSDLVPKEEPKQEKSFWQSLMPPSREEIRGDIERYYKGKVPEEHLKAEAERIGGKFAPEFKPPSDPFTAIPTAGAFGGLAGAVAPEVTRGVGVAVSGLGRIVGAVPYPLVRGAGAGMQALGAGMQAAAPTVGRVIPSLLGAAGGITGETAGQAAEAFGMPGAVSEGARIVGGMIPSVATRGTVEVVKKAVGLPPGMTVSDVTKRLLKDRGIDVSDLGKSEKAQIEALVENLRSGKTKGEAAEQLYGQLASAVSDVERKASQRVGALQQALPRLAQREEAARAGIQNVGNPNAVPTDIGERARKAVIAREAALQTERGTPYAEARDAVQAAATQKQAAGQFIENTEAYKKLERELQEKTLTGMVGLQQPLASETEKGVVSAYQDVLNAIRNKQVVIGTSEVPEARALAKQLEQAGLRVREFTKDGVTTYVREFPTSYEALDTLRRRLGTSAKFGEPVEGYQALGAENAKKLYRQISDIQAEFVGPDLFRKMQNIYETGTAKLAPYGAKAGKPYTGLDLSDPQRYMKDPTALVREVTRTKTAFDDFIRLSNNPNEAKAIASDWAATQIANKNSGQVEKWIADHRDVLSHPQLADLRSKLNNYVYSLKGAEASGRTAKFLEERATKTIPAATEKLRQQIVGSDFPVPTIKNIITSGDQKTWQTLGPILGQDTRSRAALLQATREALSEMAPERAAQLFRERIAYALPNAGVPQQAVANLQNRLDAIASYQIDQPQKLTMTQNLLSQFFRQYAIPRVGGIAVE